MGDIYDLGTMAFNAGRDSEDALKDMKKRVKDLEEVLDRVVTALCYYHGPRFVQEAECAQCSYSCKLHHYGTKGCPNFKRGGGHV